LKPHPHGAHARTQPHNLTLKDLDLPAGPAHILPQLPGIGSNGQGNFLVFGHLKRWRFYHGLDQGLKIFSKDFVLVF
jgi:hypothetical protein